MPYAYTTATGRVYYLHHKPVTLQNGRELIVYYFASQPKPGATLEAVPTGYAVAETDRSQRPSLRKLQSP